MFYFVEFSFEVIGWVIWGEVEKGWWLVVGGDVLEVYFVDVGDVYGCDGVEEEGGEEGGDEGDVGGGGVYLGEFVVEVYDLGVGEVLFIYIIIS